MKNQSIYLFLLASISLASCKSIVSNPGKPLIVNTLEIGKVYEIQDFDANIYNVRIKEIDNDCFYGTSNKKEVVIKKSTIRQIKKWETLNSIIVGILAISALIFIPI